MGMIFTVKNVRNALFFLLAIIFFWEAFLTFSTAPKQTPWDFQAFWGAGKALNNGLDPYDPNAMQRLSVQVTYLSPIFVGEAFQPLANIPFMTAKMLWTGFNILAAIVIILLILHLSKIKITPQSFFLGLAILMAFEPFSGTIYLAQTDLLVLLALALSWLCLEQNQPFLAGLLFCIGATNPHLITGIGLYYLYRSIWRREYQLLLGIIVGGLVIIAACLYHLPYFVEWITSVLPSTGSDAIQSPIQVTTIHVTDYFTSFYGIGNYEIVSRVIVALLIIMISFASIMVWTRSSGKTVSMEITMAVILTLLVSPYAYHQDFLILVLVVPSLFLLLKSNVSVSKVAILFITVSTFFFSSMVGFINVGVNEFRMPFYYFAPFLVILMGATQLKRIARPFESLIWVMLFAFFSLGGSYLPQILGIQVVQSEMLVIFIGLLLFVAGMWFWHPLLGGEDNARFIRSVWLRWFIFAGLRYCYRKWTKVAHTFLLSDKSFGRLVSTLRLPLPPKLDLSWITSNLAVGGKIPTDMVGVLADLPVHAVVDMRSEEQDNADELNKHHISFLGLPTADNHAVAVNDLLLGARWITDIQEKGGRVYVHCQHGVGRSVMLVIATLIYQGSSLEDSFRLTLRHRWQAGLNVGQARQLQIFSAMLGQSSEAPTLKRSVVKPVPQI
jgi:protein-tyrosine phosphatase